MRALVFAAALAGCTQSATVLCPSGRICPLSTTCVLVAEVETCASMTQLDACDGKAELASCAPDDERFVCIDGVCLDPCGNGHVDPGEDCDDANVTAGDGCSVRCHFEECGNGVVDDTVGEQCDDGAAVSGDGCSARCEVEYPAWEELTADVISPRVGVALAYLPSADRVLAFGGAGPDGFLADTWLRSDGGLWTIVDTAIAPVARENHSMIYDPMRDRVVLFGGFGTNGPLADTWEWDGTRWIERTPAVSPPPRFGTQIAYDIVRQRVVLHGGRNVTAALDDTWEWDGTSWTPKSVAVRPTGHYDVQLGYDPQLQQLVYCGNDGAAPATWRWTGTAWINMNTPCPSGTSGTNRMTFDWRRGHLTVLIGGLDQAYTWTGTAWSLLASSGTPSRKSPGFAADRGGVIVLGGRDNNNTIVGDVWWLDSQSTQWAEELTRASTPSGRHGASVATDPTTGLVYVFGGERVGGSTDNVWTWGAQRWSPYSGSMPSVRRGAAMTWDVARGNIVLFGGGTPSPAQDTWTYADSLWTLKNVSPKPLAREGATMAFDAKRGQAILFGGRGATEFLDDTWMWNGTTWSELSPPMSPTARMNSAMAYDPVRERIVLFGGATSGTTLAGDTWEWDGTTWIEVTVATSPAPRAGASLTFDPLRKRLVLVGGTDAPIHYATFGDWWEWDGSAWAKQGEDPRIARSGHVGFFDPVRGGIAVFSGVESSLATAMATAELWLLRYRAD